MELKEDLGINDFQFGILGSIAYGGLTLGSIVATGLFQKRKLIKHVLAGSLAFNALFLYLFTITDSFFFDAFIRFWIGFFQIYVSIYMPVWADTFADER